ncbi:MAG: Glucosyltransferase-like protein [Watsoniomyces obsoletus]|nr:MAG: Glucosyltransferase-like protein [Watsoniomyces obsoletus]
MVTTRQTQASQRPTSETIADESHHNRPGAHNAQRMPQDTQGTIRPASSMEDDPNLEHPVAGPSNRPETRQGANAGDDIGSQSSGSTSSSRRRNTAREMAKMAERVVGLESSAREQQDMIREQASIIQALRAMISSNLPGQTAQQDETTSGIPLQRPTTNAGDQPEGPLGADTTGNRMHQDQNPSPPQSLPLMRDRVPSILRPSTA